MILHLPTITRWLRSLLYVALISFTLFKITSIIIPTFLPDDPYKIPAGDALLVHAKPSASLKMNPFTTSIISQTFLHRVAQELKWFFLTGE